MSKPTIIIINGNGDEAEASRIVEAILRAQRPEQDEVKNSAIETLRQGAERLKQLLEGDGGMDGVFPLQPITADAIMENEHGAIWVADIEAMRETQGVKANEDRILAFWVQGPRAGRGDRFLLTLRHLRDDPGLPPVTNRALPEATHELVIHHLAPRDTDAALSGDDVFGVCHVHYAGQFVAPSDTEAVNVVFHALAETLSEDGKLHLTNGDEACWIERFGDHCLDKDGQEEHSFTRH